MRGILINPFTKSVNEVIISNSLESIYSIMTNNYQTVSCVEPLIINSANHLLWVDEEAAFNHLLLVDEEAPFGKKMKTFSMKEFWYPILGSGLILGFDGDDVTDATISLTEVQTRVCFN